MAFGQAHRQLVADTNKGIIEPVSSERATGKAAVGGRQTKHLSGEHDALRALVDNAATIAEPMIAKANMEKELDGYEDAGQEEGRQAAATASDVWHNKLFGSGASLRGAQERIAEDNARRVYLAAQKVLEHGNAASWNDAKWKKWKDAQLKAELDKYADSPEMQKFITNTMGRDFQKLERDRTWKHIEYTQAENRKSTQVQASGIADTYDKDRASPNIQRSQEDVDARLAELEKLKTNSGISDSAFASVMNQTAKDELAKGRKDFAEFISEQGYLDDLSFEEQQGLENAVQVFDILNGEEFGRRSNEIYGPAGLIKKGDENGAVVAYDALIKDFPQAVPEGGKNEIRRQVRQAAWGYAESDRKRKDRIGHAKDDAEHNTTTPFPVRDQFGNLTGFATLTASERLTGLQAHLAERQEAKFHKEQKEADPTYENRPLTPDERQEMYMKDTAYTAKMMEQNNLMLPEISNAAMDVVNTLNHDLLTLDEEGTDNLKTKLQRLNTMMEGNPAVRKMFKDALGDSFGKIIYADRELKKKGVTAEMLNNRLAVQAARQRQQKLSSEKGSDDDKEPVHTLGWLQRTKALKGVKSAADEDGFGPFNTASRDTNKAIVARVEAIYSRNKANSENPHSDSEDDILFENAVAEVASEGAYLSTDNGKEFFFGVGAIDDQLREAGYTEGGLNQYIKELGENQDILDDIKQKSGGDDGIELKTWWGNPLTSNGVTPIDLGGGQLALIIPRDDKKDPRRSFIYRIDVPNATDSPKPLPKKVQTDIARTQYANEIVVNDELWKEKTGDKRGVKEQLDYDLAYQVIKEEGVEKFIKRKGIAASKQGTYQTENLVSHVTREEIENHIDAHEYNKSLMDRREIASMRVVKRQRLRDNFVNNPHESARGWNNRRLARWQTLKSDLSQEFTGQIPGTTTYENGESIHYIQDGDSTEVSRAKQEATDTAYAEQRAATRQAQSDALELERIPSDDPFQRLRGYSFNEYGAEDPADEEVIPAPTGIGGTAEPLTEIPSVFNPEEIPQFPSEGIPVNQVTQRTAVRYQQEVSKGLERLDIPEEIKAEVKKIVKEAEAVVKKEVIEEVIPPNQVSERIKDPALKEARLKQNLNKLVTPFIQNREGIRFVSYNDTLGKLTGGVGHLMDKAEQKKYPLGTPIPIEQVITWYKEDSKEAKAAATTQLKAAKIDPKLQVKVEEVGLVTAKEIFESVNFQLGSNWGTKKGGFTDTWPLIKKGNYKQAIKNIKASAWNTPKQTPKRVRDLIALLTELDKPAKTVKSPGTA